jgi:hypothetical protein
VTGAGTVVGGWVVIATVVGGCVGGSVGTGVVAVSAGAVVGGAVGSVVVDDSIAAGAVDVDDTTVENEGPDVVPVVLGVPHPATTSTRPTIAARQTRMVVSRLLLQPRCVVHVVATLLDHRPEHGQPEHLAPSGVTNDRLVEAAGDVDGRT